MARETMEQLREELQKVRIESENKLILEQERHADELRVVQDALTTQIQENARLLATLSVVRAALDQVTR